jgi:uncharacterized SAM-binding protein YcdF (DUF218 family)
MYNLASKLLAPLFEPLTLAIVLAACALLAWKRRRLAFRLLVAAIALLLVFTSRVTVGALVGSLKNQYRDSGLDVPPAQAIVVLGGTIQSEVPVSLRKAVRFIPGSESESLSHVLRKQGIHIVADTVPEVVADGTYLVEPGD